MLRGTSEANRRSRELRRGMPLPKILLRRALKARPGGIRFRKRQPAGPISADLYCHEARLIIGVDGEAHGRGGRPARDAIRDAWFAERNIGVLRVTAGQVLNDLDGVVRGVVARAGGQSSRPVRSRGGSSNQRVG